MPEVWIAIAALLVALFVLAAFTLNFHRRLRLVQSLHQQELDKVRRELNAINSAAIGIGQRLISAEKKLKAEAEQRENVAPASDGQEAFKLAVSSAEQGMSPQELMEHYGLSEAEAKLMALINMRNASNHFS